MSMNQKVVLITGASSGIGRATAHLLAAHGYRVFGTSRRPTADTRAPGVEMLALDVCSDSSVAAAVGAVLERAGRIDVLVNNAGYELGGAIEEVSIEEAKRQFETNFYGAMRMMQAVLPAMRRQRSGRIINIASLAGFAPVPFLGVYSASKFALEGLSETLRYEVGPLGISVSLVEPGFLKTALATNRRRAAAHIADYDPWRERAHRALEEYEHAAPSPLLAANCILQIIESRSPRLRYRVGQDARNVSRLRRLLPEAFFERGVRGYFKLDARDIVPAAPHPTPRRN
ncbi:MAG TPA: oxidoreductase [Burkholderiales bacterium]